MHEASHIRYPSINGLRALSIIMVLYHHLEIHQILVTDFSKINWIIPVVHFFQDGQLGVNIFFCISGFLITSLAKNQNVIPIYANLFMFPQYFLSGTFFSKSALPVFLQPIIKFLPLTAVNDAMRNVAFEGASLASCWEQILILIVWGIIIYVLTAKVFRWE